MAPRCVAVAVAVGALLAHSAAAAEAPTVAEARARSLGEDDACAAGSAGGAGTCAVHALQRTSSRGAAAAATAGREVVGARVEPGTGDDTDDSEWVWPRERLDEQMRMDRFGDDKFWNQITDVFAPRMVQHCLRFNAYFWPQMSFWSQEVLRRVDVLPEDLDAAKQKQLQDFSRNASFLMCDFWMDPRQGTNWSQPVAEYMQRVRAMPSTSLEMPLLEGFFERLEARENLWSGDSCMFWASSLVCDIGHVARELSGSMGKGEDLCWDKVPVPTNGFSVFGVSLQADRPGVPDSDADFEHPEYQACQEKPLTKEILTSRCPMFGHYPAGYMNVTSWGTPFEKGSQAREYVLKCEKKLGIPDSSPPTFGEVTHRPWRADNGGVKLMTEPPEGWAPTNYFDMEDAKKAFTHSVRDAVLGMTPGCADDDWICITLALSKQRKASEKESGVTVGAQDMSPMEIHKALEAQKSD